MVELRTDYNFYVVRQSEYYFAWQFSLAKRYRTGKNKIRFLRFGSTNGNDEIERRRPREHLSIGLGSEGFFFEI